MTNRAWTCSLFMCIIVLQTIKNTEAESSESANSEFQPIFAAISDWGGTDVPPYTTKEQVANGKVLDKARFALFLSLFFPFEDTSAQCTILQQLL